MRLSNDIIIQEDKNKERIGFAGEGLPIATFVSDRNLKPVQIVPKGDFAIESRPNHCRYQF